MSSQLTACLFIFALTCVGYMTGVWSLSVVAMASLTALTLTGCLTASEALSCFSNSTVIMVGAMSVVAAGFGRTRFCSRLASWISHVAKGSLSRILLLYCLLTMLLSQMVQSPVIVFGIAAPLCMATADSMHVSRSKLALPLGVVSICTCCTLPVGNGATQAAELNSYISAYYDKLENFTGTMPSIGFFEPMTARLPMLIFTVLYCAFVMPRFCPERHSVGPVDGEKAAQEGRPPLPAFSEAAGIAVFFGTAAALMLQASVLKSIAVWQICLVGAILMVMLGVLRPKEAGQAIPLSMLLLIIGSFAMAGALSGTGAGDLIGSLIARLTRKVNNNYAIGFLFFFFPFVLAQLMSNRGAMLLFFPIACAAANQFGGNPCGLVILIEAGALTAFMTPMPTAAVPYMMEYGGYDQSDLIRGGWLYALIACVLSVGWTMTIMPVLCV